MWWPKPFDPIEGKCVMFLESFWQGISKNMPLFLATIKHWGCVEWWLKFLVTQEGMGGKWFFFQKWYYMRPPFLVTKNFQSPKRVGACVTILGKKNLYPLLSFFGNQKMLVTIWWWGCVKQWLKIFGCHPTHPHSLKMIEIFLSPQKWATEFFQLPILMEIENFQSPQEGDQNLLVAKG